MSEAIHLRKRHRPAKIMRTTSKIDIKVVHEDPSDAEEGSNIELKKTLGTSTSPPATQEPRHKVEEFAQPLHFLHYCGVCRRPLGLERDIYIYRSNGLCGCRGESAFCSMECREQHMRYDAQK